MTMNTRRPRRRGSILPLVVVSMVGMCGFVALAIDLGLIAVAKTQCQNAADAASMSGARALDGTSGQNLGDINTPATSKYIAQHTALDNKVLNDTITASNITLTYGAWHYDTTNQLFTPNFPPVSPDNYNLVQVQVSYKVQTTFAGVFTYFNPSFNSLITVQAQAQAAHRPRDVAIVLDYSGSMNNESDQWNCESYLDNGSEATTLNGYKFPAAGNPGGTSNNTDTVYPLFGPYAGTTSTAQSTQGNDYSDYLSNPNLLCPAAVTGNSLHGNNMIGKANTMHDLTAAQGVPAMVTDFWQNNRGGAAVAAFTSAGNGDATGWVAGDKYLFVNKSGTPTTTYLANTTYAMNVNDLVNKGKSTGVPAYTANWENNGYKQYTGNGFNGYTQGPGYWGKTFFIWPPDPSPASTDAAATVNAMKAISAFSGAKTPSGTGTGTNDWRQNFFYNQTGSAPLTDNTQLFQDGSGNSSNNGIGYNDPAGNYVINYKAILYWIKNCGPNPFPTLLRSGNVQIYGSIPSDVGGSPVGPTGPYDHTQLNSNIANADQRFWKEYIDWTLGVWRDPTGSIQHTFTSTCSVGPDFRYDSGGSIDTSGPTSGGIGGSGTNTVQIHALPGLSGSNQPYMNYLDNPWRPRHRLWFGPGTMIQFMMDCGYLPGTTHDISMFPMKQGVGGALTDIQNNHPNDLIAMLLFSRPVYGNDPPGIGKFNVPQYSLTNDYASMLTSLWVPPGSGSLSSDVKIFGDSNAVLIPSAHGDFDSNTASSFGFMQTYNQFSGNRSSLVNQTGMGGTGTATVGGLGRKGATRLVIFETDGMANEDSQPTGGNNGFTVGPTGGGAYNSYYNIRPADTVNGAGYSQNNLLSVVEAICNHDDATNTYTVPSGAPTPPAYPGYATVNKPVIVQCIAFGAIFENSNSIQTSAVSLLQDVSTIGGTTFPSSASDPTNGYKWCIGTLQQRQQKLQKAFLTILDSSVPVSLIQ
jgi:Flp pilus assembly protein TadG